MASVHAVHTNASLLPASSDTWTLELAYPAPVVLLGNLTASGRRRDFVSDVRKIGDRIISATAPVRTVLASVSAEVAFLAREGAGIPSRIKVSDSLGNLIQDFEVPQPNRIDCGVMDDALCSVATPDDLDGAANVLTASIVGLGGEPARARVERDLHGRRLRGCLL